MKTTKHPTELTDAEAAAIVDAFDDAPDASYVVTEQDALIELRAAAAAVETQRAASRLQHFAPAETAPRGESSALSSA